MDFNESVINTFAKTLQKRDAQKSITLYSKNNMRNNNASQEQYKPNDVVLNVTQQLKAIQNADNMKKYQTKQNPTNKFETQFASDTQLINIIKDAEAVVDAENGITQEFDTTFCQKDIFCKACGTKNCTEFQCTNKNKRFFDRNITKPLVSLSKEGVDQSIHSINAKIEDNIDNTEIICDNISVKENGKYENESNANSNTSSSLVFKLESFEKFESIALPLIKEDLDLEAAKQLINSEILNRELFIQTHEETVLNDRDKQHSPIFKARSKITSQSLKFNKNIVSKPKICPKSRLKKDSILFSSDEEDDIQREFEDLPLTCALQIPFKKEPQEPNETIYVGFQTASDKSIQVCSDSFYKANTIFNQLMNVDELNLSLKKIVEVKDNITNNSSNDMVAKNHVDIDEMINSNIKMENTSKLIYQNEISYNNNLLKSINITPSNISEKGSFDEEKSNTTNLIPVKSEIQTSLKNNSVNYCKTDKFVASEFDLNFTGNKNEQRAYNLIKEKAKNDSILSRVEFMTKKENGTNVPRPILIKTHNNYEGKSGLIKSTKKHFKLSENILNELDNCFKGINSCTEQTVAETENIFQGFKTASNKHIEISHLALSKTKSILQNIDINDNDNINNKAAHNFNVTRKQPYPNAAVSANYLNAKFKTDSGNIIDKCENMVTNNLDDLQNMDEQYLSSDAINAYSTCTLQEFKNKILTDRCLETCVEDLNKAESNCQEKRVHNFNDKRVLNPLYDIDSSSRFQGFKTASNNPVSITEAGLILSKQLFKDINISTSKDIKIINNSDKLKPEKDSFNLSNKGKAKIDEINRSVNKLIDENLNILKTNKTYYASSQDKTLHSLFLGFKTASNKKVKVTKEALGKVKQIFKEIVTDDTRGEKSAIYEGLLEEPLNPNGNVKPTKVLLEKDLGTNNPLIQPFDEENLKKRETEIVNNLNSHYMFQGFKTASNKLVQVSADALAKSKRIFEDMEPYLIQEQAPNLEAHKTKLMIQNNFSGFKTASNKKVKISDTALLKSRKLLESMDLQQDLCQVPINKKISDINACISVHNDYIKNTKEALLEPQKLVSNEIEPRTDIKVKQEEDQTIEYKVDSDIFDTEVIKDFEETVYTEDFIKETPTSKRSGSPILPCPTAKKRKKIETPQGNKKLNTPKDRETTLLSFSVYKFSEDYKKSKICTVKDINEAEKKDSKMDIDPYILNFQFDTLLEFEFIGQRNDIDSNIWTTDKIIRCFTDSVNKKIIPQGWIENHMKLIIWKLLSYEIRFQRCMANVCTVKNILNQLKFRYDKELYNVERPALRKIMEKDEVSTKRMILCIAGIYVDGVRVTSVTSENQSIELLLTDGWYCIKACIDKMISNLVYEGKIIVGMKLVIHGAELLNCDQGIAPWEDTSSIRLKIFGNSVRRAKWYARLGFHGHGAILTNLSNVKTEGGKISQLRILVTRVYPLLYIEKFEDGSTVTRSERMEHLHQMKYEAERQIQIEKLYEEVEKSSDKEFQDSEGAYSCDKAIFDSDSQISRLLKKSKIGEEFRENLTSSQAHLLQQHTMKQREKQIEKFQKKVKELMKKRGLDVARNVVPLMKIKVADIQNEKISKAMITIWRPNEYIQEIITEGAWIDLYNVVPTSVRYSELQISAGRQSVFVPSKIKEVDRLKTYKETLKRKCHTIKDLHNPSMNTDYNEVDTVGLIFLIEPSIKEFNARNEQFQNMYLTDADKNILCVNFWGGIIKYGFENILETGQFITCVNLQKRTGNSRKNIPQYRATEFTLFTKTSKNESIRKEANYLVAKFFSLDKRKFIEDCVAIRNNYNRNIQYGNNENVSPYRINNTEYNISKNKLFIDSPLVNNCIDVNLNLTGLDFESTFKQSDTQELSPNMLLRKKKVKEKIDKLKMYEEPPPLAAIHIINKSSDAVKPFKSPFTKNDISPSVTVANDVHKNQKENINSSPVLLLNRTNVKRTNINPVRLDFSRSIQETLAKDPFTDDFDGSPPLSLD